MVERVRSQKLVSDGLVVTQAVRPPHWNCSSGDPGLALVVLALNLLLTNRRKLTVHVATLDSRLLTLFSYSLPGRAAAGTFCSTLMAPCYRLDV